MGHKTDYPWEAIKGDYLAGLAPSVIVARYPGLKYGTLNKRIHREDWKGELERLRDVVRERTIDSLTEQRELALNVNRKILEAAKSKLDSVHHSLINQALKMVLEVDSRNSPPPTHTLQVVFANSDSDDLGPLPDEPLEDEP